jgi:gamma-glutamyl-gamma-aminobutyrate hydrolase PuuD
VINLFEPAANVGVFGRYSRCYIEGVVKIVRLFIGTLGLLIVSFSASAQTADGGVGLIVWQPKPGLPAVLLPRLEGETPTEAVQSYITSIVSDHRFANMLSMELMNEMVVGRAMPFERKSKHLLTGVMANTFHDIVGAHRAVEMMERIHRGQEVESYMLAPSAGLRLPKELRQDYFKKVASLLELYVGMGGEDWTPFLYGEMIEGAIDFNATNDREEADLRTEIIKKGKAFRALVCRSMQSEMTLLYGYGLIQDLPSEGYGTKHRGPVKARIVQHPLQIQKDSNFARYLMPYITRRGLKPNQAGLYTIPFNSWHHEAADFKKGTVNEGLFLDFGSHAVGFGPRGVLEVSEGPNYLATQGHWELSIPGKGDGIGHMIVQGFKMEAYRWRETYARANAASELKEKSEREKREFMGRRCEGLFL